MIVLKLLAKTHKETIGDIAAVFKMSHHMAYNESIERLLIPNVVYYVFFQRLVLFLVSWLARGRQYSYKMTLKVNSENKNEFCINFSVCRILMKIFPRTNFAVSYLISFKYGSSLLFLSLYKQNCSYQLLIIGYQFYVDFCIHPKNYRKREADDFL